MPYIPAAWKASNTVLTVTIYRRDNVCEPIRRTSRAHSTLSAGPMTSYGHRSFAFVEALSSTLKWSRSSTNTCYSQSLCTSRTVVRWADKGKNSYRNDIVINNVVILCQRWRIFRTFCRTICGGLQVWSPPVYCTRFTSRCTIWCLWIGWSDAKS